MTAVFLAAFIAGLLLGVRVMLYGVERGTRPFGAPAPTPAPVRAWEPMLAAFLSVFGLMGYLGTRYRGDDPLVLTLVAVAVAVAVAFAAYGMVRRAAAFVPEHDPDDPRYVLQGHVATVTAAITDEAPGEIAFQIDRTYRVVPARGIDGAVAGVGAEVVIDRIDDDGVAHVEPWAEVEKRL